MELLPTVTENILEALSSERITEELQQKKAKRLERSAGTSEIAPSEYSSGAASTKDEDSKSLSSFQSESYVHASQVATSSSEAGEQKPQRTKVQLWNDLKIICKQFYSVQTMIEKAKVYQLSHEPSPSCTPSPFLVFSLASN